MVYTYTATPPGGRPGRPLWFCAWAASALPHYAGYAGYAVPAGTLDGAARAWRTAWRLALAKAMAK